MSIQLTKKLPLFKHNTYLLNISIEAGQQEKAQESRYKISKWKVLALLHKKLLSKIR